MATGALSGSIEKCLARFRIANQDVQDLVRSPVGRRINLRMQERGDIGNLRGGQARKTLHAFVGSSNFQEVSELFAILVIENDNGTHEVGSAVTASRVCAVTETAVHKKGSLAAFDRGRIKARRWSRVITTLALRREAQH